MPYGVTQQMIDSYGEVVFKLSLNKQVRLGDAVRELDFAAIEAGRAGTGLTDGEIAGRVGLLPEQVGVVRVFMERKYHKIDQHRRIFGLGGGKRWKADDYRHPRERLAVSEEAMALRRTLAFPPERAAQYLEEGLWIDETLSGWLTANAERAPEAPAVIHPGANLTYGALKEQVDGLARGLLGLGIRKGDVVGVQLPNIPEFIACYLAISAIGAVTQTIHMAYAEKDISFLLHHGRARAVICLAAFKDFPTARVMREIQGGLDSRNHVIVVGGGGPEGTVDLADLFAGDGPEIDNPPVGADPFILLYTSGTVSNPKGVPLTYQNMLSNARLSAPEFGITADDRILTPAPYTHLYGIFSFDMGLHVGAAQVLLEAYSPLSLARTVEKEKPTILFLGPPHASALLGEGLMDAHDFSSVRLTVFSGSYCPPDLLARYQAQIPGSTLSQLWGMTELEAGCFSRPAQGLETALHSAGPPAPGNEVRIVSEETGEVLGPDTEGELQIRGCSVFAGYLDNAEANADAFVAGGWFRTGDLALIDGDGNLRITGRAKDIINRGGIKFNPEDIENLLTGHPKITAAAIVPVPDPDLGERACCFAVTMPGETVDLEEIRAFLEAQKVSKNKWPERLEIIDELPMTPTRKVQKGRLMERLKVD